MILKDYTLTINRFNAGRTIDRYENMSFSMAKSIWNDEVSMYSKFKHVRDMTMRCQGKIIFATTFRESRED